MQTKEVSQDSVVLYVAGRSTVVEEGEVGTWSDGLQRSKVEASSEHCSKKFYSLRFNRSLEIISNQEQERERMRGFFLCTLQSTKD